MGISEFISITINHLLLTNTFPLAFFYFIILPLVILTAIFLGLLIWATIKFCKDRQQNPNSKKYLPIFIGFLITFIVLAILVGLSFLVLY